MFDLKLGIKTKLEPLCRDDSTPPFGRKFQNNSGIWTPPSRRRAISPWKG
jgi:hypothetical protein